MYFYQRLKDLREDKDLNQADIAALLQTTQQTYSLWERGDREIPLHHAITLAKFYKVSLDYLAGLTNNKKRDIGQIKKGNNNEVIMEHSYDVSDGNIIAFIEPDGLKNFSLDVVYYDAEGNTYEE